MSERCAICGRSGHSSGRHDEAEIARMRAMLDVLLPVARLYVDAFSDDEAMSLPERLALQRVEDIVADPDGWRP